MRSLVVSAAYVVVLAATLYVGAALSDMSPGRAPRGPALRAPPTTVRSHPSRPAQAPVTTSPDLTSAGPAPEDRTAATWP
jgi:hypothetical protein